ncbi:hypothetical protein JB92DRAFT_2877811 [Gautieria morchelliformis]|nr:hypothetical protein JB92DRAFT_2877811 [Gautieria morchelliformis]
MDSILLLIHSFRRLTAHTSCVNALAWSGDGRWLASAGDGRPCLPRSNGANSLW